jgi:hypothetical protein
MTLANIK